MVLFVLTCCTPKQYVAGKTTIITKEIVRHDTIIDIQADSASAVALLKCDSDYNVVLEDLLIANGEKIKLEAMLEDGKMNINADTPKDTIVVERADTVYKEQEVVTVVEYRMTDFQKSCYDGFWWLLAMILLFVGYKIVLVLRKYFMKF